MKPQGETFSACVQFCKRRCFRQLSDIQIAVRDNFALFSCNISLRFSF